MAQRIDSGATRLLLFTNPLKPVHGMITVPTDPGIGVALGKAKIETAPELR